MEVLRAENYPVSAWKNRGGETRQIAVFPPGADMDRFDWRLSMATVVQDGPFSIFEGIDRTLFVLDGKGIELAFKSGPTETLRRGEVLPCFPADAKLDATLIDGPITDLNIMTRRMNVRHAAFKICISGWIEIGCQWTTTVIFCVSGTPTFSFSGETEILGQHDCAVLDKSIGNVLTVDGEAKLIVVGIDIAMS